MRHRVGFLAVLLLFAALAPLRAETPDEWVALGTRVHGGFGVLIPIGIRIGLDARTRLTAAPRELTVEYHSGANAPCPCIADGIAIATTASAGQGSLRIAAPTADDQTFGSAVITNVKTKRSLLYTIPTAAVNAFLPLNAADVTPLRRYQAVMDAPADQVFSVRELPSP